MAQQLYERFAVQRYYGDVSELLENARPDVVHITTPPESHFELARFCLDRGCHVYVEKPFTLNAADAETLITLANERGLRLTVGHDDQFSHVARRMRALVERGYLGGRPVHVESHYGYDLGDSYARAVLGDKAHWVRALPGKLLQNLISHGIARIAEFLTAAAPRVTAYGFTSPRLQAMGERDIVDELRVLISEETGLTAYFTFSSQMRPVLQQLRVYGPENGLILDQAHGTLIKLRGRKFKSYAESFVPPVIFAGQHLGSLAANLRTFMARDFHMKSGMKYLIESFYRSIIEGTPGPIPYPDILLAARIMDSIFHQLGAAATPGLSPSQSQ